MQGGPGSGVGPVWPCVVFTLVLPSALLSGARVCVSQPWLCPLGPHTARPCAPLFCCTEAGLRTQALRAGSAASLVALVVKNVPAHAGDAGSIPGLGESPGEGTGTPAGFLSGESHGWMEGPSGYSRGVAKSRTRLSTQLTPHRA